MTEEKIVEFPISFMAMREVPVHSSHRRGKNWLAVIQPDPTAPGGLARRFLPRAHGEWYYAISELKPGDAVEFGADYYTASGRKQPRRWYGIVLQITDQSIRFAEAETPAQLFELRSKLRDAR